MARRLGIKYMSDEELKFQQLTITLIVFTDGLLRCLRCSCMSASLAAWNCLPPIPLTVTSQDKKRTQKPFLKSISVTCVHKEYDDQFTTSEPVYAELSNGISSICMGGGGTEKLELVVKVLESELYRINTNNRNDGEFRQRKRLSYDDVRCSR